VIHNDFTEKCKKPLQSNALPLSYQRIFQR
jgi:hypothetical protein